jgi:hypothetical protein
LIEEFKNPTQGTKSEEWLRVYNNQAIDLITIVCTSIVFYASLGVNLQRKIEIPKELKVYSIGRCLGLILLKEKMAFTSILRRVRIEGKIGVHGTTLNMFYNALEDLSFDIKFWS